MEKVIRDGKVAVLYSPGFGAGWSKWNREIPEIVFHPILVKMVEEGKRGNITDAFLENLFGVEYAYAGGASDLKIKWIPEGTRFVINEYDGSESIELLDSIDYFVA